MTLAKQLLLGCISHMQEVCANINNAYNTYMNVDRFSRKFSRTLIGRSIKALFDVTQNYWDQVAKIEDLL